MEEQFIKNVKVLTMLKGLKISDLEREIGVSQGYFMRLRNNTLPNLKIALKIANVLNVSISDLCYGEVKFNV